MQFINMWLTFYQNNAPRISVLHICPKKKTQKSVHFNLTVFASWWLNVVKKKGSIGRVFEYIWKTMQKTWTFPGVNRSFCLYFLKIGFKIDGCVIWWIWQRSLFLKNTILSLIFQIPHVIEASFWIFFEYKCFLLKFSIIGDFFKIFFWFYNPRPM